MCRPTAGPVWRFVVTVIREYGAMRRTLYEMMAQPPRPRPEQPNQPAPPGTILTATIETVDNDRATALLPGAIAP